MGLGNPVDKAGRIQANGEPWKGTPIFRVTATFQQHAATGRALGIDFGNGRCGDPVTAMEAGTVTLAGLLGAANVVRIRHPNGYTSGYAHLSTISVKVGQAVTKGQPIGQLGKTGADACHLHGGYTNPAGAEVDFWPLLDQNKETDVTTIVDSVLFVDAAGNPTTRPIHFDAGTYTGYRLDGGKKSVTVGASGSSAPANATCTILQSPDKDPHGPNWLRITAGSFLGFYVRKGTGITVPDGPDATASYNAGVDAAAAKAKEAHK